MSRAMSVKELLKMKRNVLDFEGEWRDAFGTPERCGVWFVWGQSGNGKSSFVMNMCKELARFGKVVYDSLEEGFSLSMANTVERFGLLDSNGRISIDCCSMDELSEKMSRRKSADFWVIDSFQYSQLSYKSYIRFKEAHPDKLVIFISQADGKRPSGRAATSVMYDSALKIYVEGFRAFSKGRYIGPKGYYTVWEEGARKYWGEEVNTSEE